MKRSKKYLAALEKVDQKKKYSVAEAAALLPQISLTKFAGSVEAEMLISLNEKQKKETVRGSYVLPNKFGSEVKVLVLADPANQEKAKGADIVGGEELVKDIEAGKLQFDLVIATPMMMPKIARLGKTLGSKGLMPNPKNGTVTDDVEKAIARFKAGTRNFKMLEGGKIVAVVGKTDMTAEQIKSNLVAFYNAVMAEVKRFGPTPVKSVIVSPTMGPRIAVDINDFASAA